MALRHNPYLNNKRVSIMLHHHQASKKMVPLDGYTKYKLQRLAQEYVVEGDPKPPFTKERAVAKLLKQGYRI